MKRCICSLVCLALFLAAAPAHATIPTGNLVVDGDAETGAHAGDAATTVNPPASAWTITQDAGVSQVAYGSPGGFPSAYTGSGSAFFAGGPGADGGHAVKEMQSTTPINLSMAAAEIAAGTVQVNFGADIGGFQVQTDTAFVRVTFYNSTDQVVSGGNITLGPVTPTARSNETKLVHIQAPSLNVPLNSDHARIVVHFQDGSGAYHDGYVDNITLTLQDTSQPPDTIIDTGPSGLTNTSRPTFSFHATLGGSTFQCKIDSDPLGACSGPGAAHTPPEPGLDDGPHTFSVVATKGAMTDPTPASRSFMIDAHAPFSTVDFSGTQNDDGTYDGPVTISATASDAAGTGVAGTHCAVDPAGVDPAHPPAYADMPDCALIGSSTTVSEIGTHTVYIASRDNAGNEEITKQRAFQIAAPASTTPPPPITGVSVPNGAPKPGEANVLVAQTTPEAATLDWDVNGDGKSDATCPADEPAIRFDTPPAVAGGARAKDLARHATVTANPLHAITDPVTVAVNFPPAPPKDFSALPAKTADLLANKEFKLPLAYCAKPADFLDNQGHDIFADLLSRAEGKCVSLAIETATIRVQGCFLPVGDDNKVPDAEKETIKAELSSQYDVKSDDDVDAWLAASHTLVARGPVFMNGVVLQPIGDGAVVFSREMQRLIASNASLKVGNIPIDVAKAFEIDTASVGDVDLGWLERVADKGLQALGGFGVTGKVHVTLVHGKGLDAHADVLITLKLPPWLGGATAQVTATVGRDGNFHLNGTKFALDDITLPGVKLSKMQLTYMDSVWRGQASLCITELACIDATPAEGVVPPGGVTFGPGDDFRIFANVIFPGDGISLYPGVFLTRVGAGIAQPPLRLLGGAQIKALSVFEVDGALALAFASANDPYKLAQDRDTLGGNFPAGAYNVPHRDFTVAASAAGFLHIPVIDAKIPLGNGYFVADLSGSALFGGGIDEDFLGVIRVIGRTDGGFDAKRGKFTLLGTAKACIGRIPLLGNLCEGSTVAISSVGAGGCVDVGPFSVGGGVTFRDDDIHLWPLDGCKWSPFYDFSIGTTARAARAGGLSVTTKAGDMSRVVELTGRDGAPKVHVVAANGKTLDSTDGPGLAYNDSIHIMRSEALNMTVVGLVNPAAGRNRIDLLPGSPAIKSIRSATDQPAARIKARVTGHGVRRTLVYDIGRRAKQLVTFSEVSPEASHVIGTTTGGRGKLSFKPSSGTSPHAVVAQFQLDGLQAEHKTVVRFKPPSPRLPRVGRLVARHKGTRVTVRWRGVAGAAAYDVVVKPEIGPAKRAHTSKHSAVLGGLVNWARGTVTVKPVATGRAGAARKAKFRSAGKRPRAKVYKAIKLKKKRGR